jgi:lysophospholipase L1-like esterase
MKPYWKWGESLHAKTVVDLIVAVFCLLADNTLQATDIDPLRIMPLGDSITAGYTDNPKWQHPFEFGYRSGLYKLLKNAGYNFQFVGESPEPWDGKWRVPSNHPSTDLRRLQMDKHRGYGGWNIMGIQKNVTQWIKEDRPNVILLLIGINGINTNSSKQLDSLVKTIFETDKNVKLIVAQITPLGRFNKDLFDYNTYIRETLVPTYAGKGYTINTVDLYKHFLTDLEDPESIDAKRLSNGINHPTNPLYDKMAESWFQGIKLLLTDEKQ